MPLPYNLLGLRMPAAEMSLSAGRDRGRMCAPGARSAPGAGGAVFSAQDARRAKVERASSAGWRLPKCHAPRNEDGHQQDEGEQRDARGHGPFPRRRKNDSFVRRRSNAVAARRGGIFLIPGDVHQCGGHSHRFGRAGRRAAIRKLVIAAQAWHEKRERQRNYRKCDQHASSSGGRPIRHGWMQDARGPAGTLDADQSSGIPGDVPVGAALDSSGMPDMTS